MKLSGACKYSSCHVKVFCGDTSIYCITTGYEFIILYYFFVVLFRIDYAIEMVRNCVYANYCIIFAYIDHTPSFLLLSLKSQLLVQCIIPSDDTFSINLCKSTVSCFIVFYLVKYYVLNVNGSSSIA
mmetsp:Transcript_23221/g.39329  ORF Transcript_23221/g.39329 Transcript_23221/m.39329 type:complete len:127 (-) Transcript_23221:49-429(-)